MLIRLFIKNYYSFGEAKEFNMLPSPRYKRLPHHKYNFNGIHLLKLSAIYGANAAGKSNLIKSLSTLKDIVIEEELPTRYESRKFKFDDQDSSQVLGVEFIQGKTAFYYAIETKDRIVVTEELFKSGLGKTKDELVFERKTDKEKNTTINFCDEFLLKDENVVLKKVIEKNLSKPNKPILKLLTTLDNEQLKDANNALMWFEDTLHIIMPNSKANALAHRLDIDDSFKKYAEHMICSFDVGICSIAAEKKEIESVLGDDKKEHIELITKEFEESDSKVLGFFSPSGNEINIVQEEDGVYVKSIQLEHLGKNGTSKKFDIDEESDGTMRLLDFIPAFKNVASDNRVILVDEIERSIHPLLIKELVKKFSNDDKTNGQFIFTTHESNLLDQEIFRQDEIWFIEKDSNACSDIYSLSDFKEHSTKDIRKGYLNGRYGSIPFLANLNDLNWHNNHDS